MTVKKTTRVILENFSSSIQKNQLILVLSLLNFALHFPSLFEPTLNNHETLIITVAKNLLPASSVVSLWDQISVWFARISFFVFGATFWSVKFSLLVYYLLALFLLNRFLVKAFPKQSLLTACVLALVFGLPYFGTTQLTTLTLLLPAVVYAAFFSLKQVSRSTVLAVKKSILVLILPVVVGLLLLLANREPKIHLSYYLDFAKYALAKIQGQVAAEENYFTSFGTDVAESYSLAYFVGSKSQVKDTIFVVGKQISIYFLANRKAAATITGEPTSSSADKTVTELANNYPKFILYDKTVGNFGELDSLLQKDYNFLAQTNNVKIYSKKTS